MELSSYDVKQLWYHMQRRYGTTVIDKRTAPLMSLAAGFLPTPGFLTDYATTIGTRIYLPFTPGTPIDGWSLEAQCAVAAHEHEHVVQYRRDGFRFMVGYVFSTARRAAYETEAYRASLEMHYFLTGSVGDPDRYADGLLAYGCSATDVAVARKTLEDSADRIRSGEVATEGARTAIGFLRSEMEAVA